MILVDRLLRAFVGSTLPGPEKSSLVSTSPVRELNGETDQQSPFQYTSGLGIPIYKMVRLHLELAHQRRSLQFLVEGYKGRR